MEMNYFKKTGKMMVAACMLAGLPFIPGTVSASELQTQMMSVQMESTTLKELFDLIEEKFNYTFLIRNNDINLNERISIDMSNRSVEEILTTALKNQHADFVVNNNRIVVYKSSSNPNELRNAERMVAQQTITISGTIVDAVTGEPVIGANVLVKGTTNGTSTDFDGKFSLEAPAGATLVVSYIGYVNHEVKATSAPMTIRIKEDTQNLEEVVVVGYGVQKKESLTGAMQVVSNEKLLDATSPTVENLLSGKAPGVQVTSGGGQPGAAGKVVIRGKSTVNGSTDPLWIVDGVIVGTDAGSLNPADIESMSILKDAASTAIYGSQGANGVIVVTTKKGSQEGLNISVNSSTMFNAGYLVLPEVQHGYSTGQGGKYTAADFVWGDKLDIGRTAVQYDPYTYEWKEMPLVSKGKDNFKNFLETGFITNNNISISQTGKYGSFRSSLSHVYNKGQYPNQRLNKITYSVGGDMKFGKLSFEGGAIYNKRFYPNGEGAGYGGGGYIYNLLVWTGTDYDVRDYKNYWRKKDEEQNWMNDVWYDNPYYLAHEMTSSNDYDKVNTYLSGKYDIMPWLNFSMRAGADAYASRTEKKNAMSARGGWDKNGYFYTSKSTGFSFNGDALLSANHSFGDFAIDGFVGGTIYYYYDDAISSNTRNGLSIPGYYSLKASVDPIASSSSYKQKQVNSIYGKFSASWKSTVFVDVTARNDWSSTLPSETRSYFYPAVSGSIIMSQLLKMPEWLNFWKLRGAWTVTKSDLGIYDTNQAYSVSTNVWDGMNTAVYPEMIRSTTLEPTAARSYEIGTAFNVWDNRLRFDISYYNKLKYNLTREATISGSSGFTKTLVNYDEEQVRRGVEVSLTASLIQTKDWNWEVNANWARDRYFYAKVDPVYSTQKPWVAAGKRWDWYGIYDWERDPQGNIIHENGYPVQSKYQSVMGNEYPDWIWGLSTTLRYKDWTLGISLDGRVGGMAYSRTEQTMWNTGVHPDSDNKWRYDEVVNGKKNYVGQGVKVVSGKVEYDTTGKIVSDTRVFAPNDTQVSYESYIKNYNPWSGGKVYQNVHDCTFLKLRELSLLYTMPKSVCEKIHMKGVTLGLIGQNLLIWMKEFKYADPDVDSDDLNSPSMRYVGFNVKFDL